MEAQGNHTEFTRTVCRVPVVANEETGFHGIPPYAPSHGCDRVALRAATLG